MRRLSSAAVSLGLFLSLSAAASAQSVLTKVESKFSVKETSDRLAKALEDKGIKVAARIDHAAGAKAAGLEMPATEVVMFGNPKLGTPLMLANPEVAIDLPMKALIWQDKAGKVWLGYLSADALKQRYALSGQEEPLKAMAGALAAFSKAATGAN